MKGIAICMMAAAAILAGGCARLQVFDDEAMTHETGFKFHVSKPYLLVALTGPETISTTIVNLPDQSKPYWVKPLPGLIGTSNLKMDFENGIMKSFGQDVTSNVTGLLDSIGNVRKAFAEAAALAKKDGQETQVDMGAVIHPFLLYEITYENGKTNLKLVTPPDDQVTIREKNKKPRR